MHITWLMLDKFNASQVLPHGWVTGNKNFAIDGLSVIYGNSYYEIANWLLAMCKTNQPYLLLFSTTLRREWLSELKTYELKTFEVAIYEYCVAKSICVIAWKDRRIKQVLLLT